MQKFKLMKIDRIINIFKLLRKENKRKKIKC